MKHRLYRWARLHFIIRSCCRQDLLAKTDTPIQHQQLVISLVLGLLALPRVHFHLQTNASSLRSRRLWSAGGGLWPAWLHQSTRASSEKSSTPSYEHLMTALLASSSIW